MNVDYEFENGLSYVYVLRLEQGKYYVGKSVVPEIRLKHHFKKNGSYWTKKYKPIEIVEIVKEESSFHEEMLTLKYMEKYGIDNVRGGSFCRSKIDEKERYVLNRMFMSANDVCFLCGSDDHFNRHCPENPKNFSLCTKIYKLATEIFDCYRIEKNMNMLLSDSRLNLF